MAYTHLFSRYLLHIYYVTIRVPGTEDIAVINTDKVPALWRALSSRDVIDIKHVKSND